MYTTIELIGTENHRPMTREENPDFYFGFQLGVLLALKEDGILNEMQYRSAENMLKKQHLSAPGGIVP